jgi:hypothetical protein
LDRSCSPPSLLYFCGFCYCFGVVLVFAFHCSFDLIVVVGFLLPLCINVLAFWLLLCCDHFKWFSFPLQTLLVFRWCGNNIIAVQKKKILQIEIK